MSLQENVSLKNYNTFSIAARARYFGAFKSLDALRELLSESTIPANGIDRPLILGGGSNLLFTKDFDGLVLKNDLKGISVASQVDDAVYVTANAGENWQSFVGYCIENGIAGVENLSLIPGNVGASPMQNIGAYGVEIKDVFHSLQAYHLQDGNIVTFNLQDCEFGYRESVFKNKYKGQFAILNVTYRLSTRPQFNISYGSIAKELELMGVKDLSLRAVANAVINIRKSKLPDPAVIGNAGSFFKNPEVDTETFEGLLKSFPGIVGYKLPTGGTKLAAGWLIEQCGWKGYRKNDAGCHSRQALVLVNYGNASGEEIFSLSEQIIQSVIDKFGITLHREVNII